MKLYVHVQRLTVLAGCCSIYIYIYIYICITPLIFVVGRAWGRSSHLGLEKRWSATMRGNLVCFVFPKEALFLGEWWGFTVGR